MFDVRAERSGMERIVWKKLKFFSLRAFSYAFFLLVPIWVQKGVELSLPLQVLLMSFYIFFLCGQWYLLGKEVDHRLRIYYCSNSSLDRLLYRGVLGFILMIIYFFLLSLLPNSIYHHFFWGTWVVLGLFYSWPTRGKIIEESMTSHLGEFRYLDSFEKTLIFITLLSFIVSLPVFPQLDNVEALKLFFDPGERLHPYFWSFMTMIYFPFKKFPSLTRIAWSLHFYLVGTGVTLLSLYSLSRFFISRRLSILTIFAFLSSWSFSKLFEHDYGASVITTYSILWLWSLLWLWKSGTYRTGLFWGLVNFYGILIAPINIALFLAQALLVYFFVFKEKTFWFRRQVFKYSILGAFFALLFGVPYLDTYSSEWIASWGAWSEQFVTLWGRKAFFILSVPAVFIFARIYWLRWSNPDKRILRASPFLLPQNYMQYDLVVLCVAFLVLYSLLIERSAFSSFSFLWFFSFLSVFPLEWLFQSIYKLRLRRNLIYLIYILICLLDSHFEGRIKIISSIFE